MPVNLRIDAMAKEKIGKFCLDFNLDFREGLGVP